MPAGTFDVVFESFDWRDARLLYARSATGTFPPPGALTRAMMSLLLGPGLPLASLREWQPLLLRALWGIHFHRWAERAGERVAAAGGSVGRVMGDQDRSVRVDDGAGASPAPDPAFSRPAARAPASSVVSAAIQILHLHLHHCRCRCLVRRHRRH